MATYLITGVTVGITSVVSDGAQVDNLADTLSPEALDGAVVPTPIVAPDGYGGFVTLDLSDAYTPPPGTALSLALSGPPLLLSGMGDVSAMVRHWSRMRRRPPRLKGSTRLRSAARTVSRWTSTAADSS